MSIEARFAEASEAAEGWFGAVNSIARLGLAGNVEAALELLIPGRTRGNLLSSYKAHAQVIEVLAPRLEVLSDGPIVWEQGRGPAAYARVPRSFLPLVWSSAHQMAADVARMALNALVLPLPGPDDWEGNVSAARTLDARRWDAAATSPEEQARCQERIRRERAKLLDQATAQEMVRPAEPIKETEDKRQSEAEEDKDAKAIAAMLAHPDWTKKQIAEYVPCHEKSLTRERYPEFMKVWDARKKARKTFGGNLRGFRSKDGNVEAWEDKTKKKSDDDE